MRWRQQLRVPDAFELPGMPYHSTSIHLSQHLPLPCKARQGLGSRVLPLQTTDLHHRLRDLRPCKILRMDYSGLTNTDSTGHCHIDHLHQIGVSSCGAPVWFRQRLSEQ